MLVKEIMTPNPITASPSDSLESAVALMLQKDVRELPVLDGDQLVGILTDRDLRGILGAGMSEVDERMMDDSVLAREVASVMSEEVETVFPNTSAGAAARLLVDAKIGAVPVVSRQGFVVGILSVTDLLDAAAPLLDELVN